MPHIPILSNLLLGLVGIVLIIWLMSLSLPAAIVGGLAIVVVAGIFMLAIPLLESGEDDE